jgi:hypothetical protein
MKKLIFQNAGGFSHTPQKLGTRNQWGYENVNIFILCPIYRIDQRKIFNFHFHYFLEVLSQKFKFEKLHFIKKTSKIKKWMQRILNTPTPCHCMAVCFKENHTFLSQFCRVWQNFENTSFFGIGDSNHRANRI